jgi:hypothetical protein
MREGLDLTVSQINIIGANFYIVMDLDMDFICIVKDSYLYERFFLITIDIFQLVECY